MTVNTPKGQLFSQRTKVLHFADEHQHQIAPLDLCKKSSSEVNFGVFHSLHLIVHSMLQQFSASSTQAALLN